MLWEPNRRTRITHEASLTTPSSWLSRQNAQPIPATSSHASTCRSPSAAAIHRGMMIPLAFAVSFPFFIPLGVSEVTPPTPVLHGVCIREIRVHVHIRIRARRGAHTGLIARPLCPLRCVSRPGGLAFRRTGEVNRAVCTPPQAGVGNRGRRVERHVRCWWQYRPRRSITV